MTGAPRVALTLTQVAHRVPGGTATSVVRLAGALLGTGAVDLTAVLARGDLRHPASMLRGSGRVTAASLPPGLRTATTSLPLPLLYDAWARWGRPSVPSATGPVDLVHVTVPLRVGVADVPFVATVHDLFPLTRPDDFTTRGARLMRGGLEWVLQHARAVMVPSATVAAACVEHGVAPDDVSVVPWGSDPTPVDLHRVDAVRRRHGLVGPYVLFVGTVEPRKNLAGLLAAVARLDRPELTVAVVGPAGWGEELDVVAAGLASPVARLGHVPDDDLPGLYAGADVFCFPSFEEGFGLPVLEAMAAGAPVVTSATTATADVAGDAALLVDPCDTAALAAALAAVLDDPELADRLRSAGFARAAAHRWSAAAGATVDVYRRVLDR